MRTHPIGPIAALVFLLGVQSAGLAQSSYRIEAGQDTRMRLTGTSTLHDWEMTASDVTGEAQFDFRTESRTELFALPSLTFRLLVLDLKSDSKGLNKNAHAALKANEHRDIVYRLASSAISPERNGYLVKTKGRLTIAGETRDILMDVYCVVNEDGSITCSGMAGLKMTDYNVEPPKFMFGAMSTGDAVELHFSVVYNAV
jgi:polyisoprenoid-binding protein YceI